jgi:tetratricopeptide (TPR) repeat protein
MPGHIFARLGLWEEDIEANSASVRAAKAAQARNASDGFDQFHADDFLIYAYLQRGDAAQARTVIEESAGTIAQMQAAHSHGMPGMHDMFGYYLTKFPVFYALEMRDWNAAAALEPVADASPESRTLTYWARIIADGHLHRGEAARADFARYEALWEEIRKGPHAYYAEGTGMRIRRDELTAWVSYATGDAQAALEHMRTAADLQDRVGQGEVDIPAREMLADMLLERGEPAAALQEYMRALELSPGRFNGLYHAAQAAEASGDSAQARHYYQALSDNAGDSGMQRPELEQARSALAAKHLTLLVRPRWF